MKWTSHTIFTYVSDDISTFAIRTIYRQTQPVHEKRLENPALDVHLIKTTI